MLQFTGPSVNKVEQVALMELELKLVGHDIVFEPDIDGGMLQMGLDVCQ